MQDQLGLHNEFQAKLRNRVRACPQNRKSTKMSQCYAASSKSSSACARPRELPPGCRGVDDSLQAWKACSSMIAEFKLQLSNIQYIWTFRNRGLNILEILHGHLISPAPLCLCARRGQQMPLELVVSHHHVLVEDLTQVLCACALNC